MTTFDRRQLILRLLRDNSSVRVADLARMLDVSEGTVRNDLTAMDEEQLLTRVRGGAIPREGALAWGVPQHSDVRANSKQRIARWAAEMIEDGSTILLDASTTVNYMAGYLRDRRSLTVVTNGIETARRFAENASNTVILIGGILRPDGHSISGTLSEKFLSDLHIQRAFVSCSGFSVETGLTETDIRDAQIKSLMIRRARETIALVDSSKFGKVGITPFAALDQIAHIFTDSDVSLEVVDRLRRLGVNLTVCEANTVSSYLAANGPSARYKIGFANLGEDMPFSVDVRRGLERAMKDAHNVDLIVADNRLRGEVALQNADDLIAKGIDLMIEYQIDEQVGGLLLNKFQQAGIPVIAVDIPIVGATFVGIDNYRSGLLAGTQLGRWIAAHWRGRVDGVIVLEEPRAGALPALRIRGQLDGLCEVLGQIDPGLMTYLNCANNSDVSEAEMVTLLNSLLSKHHLAVLCFNDDAAWGALGAIRYLGREKDVVIVGQGADRRVREAIREPDSRIIGSTGFMPEKYGGKLLDVALKILRGDAVSPAVYIEPVFIDRNNLDLHYPSES
jgi:ribose transport system substrate-binding protein